MNHFLRMGFFLVFLLMLAACGRHVVVEPEMVSSKNQADWLVMSQPVAAPPAAPPATAALPPNNALPPPPAAP